jgi:hypothetical protein
MMKKLILTCLPFLFFSQFLLAQVPQSVCYQAVATDQSGRELIGQSVRVRISILKTTASGTEEWIETHNASTDGFGLFDLQIGLGTRTGGAQTQFSNIKWGADKHFLKVEIDPTGGTNFVTMGTSQMVSVPYALFADKANTANFADSARIANRANTAAFADSARVSNRSIYSDSSRISARSIYATFSDSSRRAGSAASADSARIASRSYFSTRSDTSNIANFALTVINNQVRRADTASFAFLADSARRAAFAYRAGFADTATASHRSVNAQNALRANFADSTTASHRSQFSVNATNAQNAVNAQTAINAQFAFNAQNAVNATLAQRSVRADTANFAWYADSSRRSDQARKALLADSSNRAQVAYLAINANRAIISDSARVAGTARDDRDRDSTNEIQTLSFSNNTLTLTAPSGVTSSVNFTDQPFRAPGASIEYPLGIIGEAVLISTGYTVPAGKTLFISAVDASVTLNDANNTVLQNEPGMPIIPSGTSIANCGCSGILIPTNQYVQPLILDFTVPTFDYLVPAGKTLVIKSGSTSGGRLDLQIDGLNYSFYTRGIQSARLMVIPSGKRIRKSAYAISDRLVVTGYLLNN